MLGLLLSNRSHATMVALAATSAISMSDTKDSNHGNAEDTLVNVFLNFMIPLSTSLGTEIG